MQHPLLSGFCLSKVPRKTKTGKCNNHSTLKNKLSEANLGHSLKHLSQIGGGRGGGVSNSAFPLRFSILHASVPTVMLIGFGFLDF